jgi:DNA-binding PadR family transcriptional regulator
MSNVSNKELAVLGLLYEHHHYAHRLQEIMEKRRMDRWADLESSSISTILEKLETNKLVQSNIKEGHEKVYYITDEGKLILKEKIETILSGKSKIMDHFDLGLANLHVLSHE